LRALLEAPAVNFFPREASNFSDQRLQYHSSTTLCTSRQDG
jgi:hypothetical protein